MFTKIGSVTVYVKDQDRAKAFYTDKLGFTLVDDQPLFPGSSNRWISLSVAEGAQTNLVLLALDDMSQHYASTLGRSQSITLAVHDIHALIETLRARGVTIQREPDMQPWGTMAMIEDSEGNGLVLVDSSLHA